MHAVIATHGHCFDGLASAVVFTRLIEKTIGPHRFVYRACGYGAGQPRPDARMLNGRLNAVLDYRFPDNGEVGWFFDHHRTALGSQAARDGFERGKTSGRYFFDPEYSSCTKLIADVAKQEFELDDLGLDELVRWADTIDAARFEGPEQAISRSEPVLRMMSVIEHYGDDKLLAELVPELLTTPLREVAESKKIEDRWRPLSVKHARFIERVRERGERRGRVVFVDLTESVLESVGKFVTYALFPDSVYSVIVGLLKNGSKISVGYNPWSGHARDRDISEICARYGGGGHPVVGGISFPNTELERARRVARDIATELE
jgi:hypothetical protein